jgi:glycosyltransferase involved in cell wall biosynthesis
VGIATLRAARHGRTLPLFAVSQSSAHPLPRVLLLTREIPQGANAGSQQLLRALRDYPADRLLVVGPAPVADADRLACEYLTYPLPVTRWINSRFHSWANLANALGLVPQPRSAWLQETISRFKPDLIVTVMDCFSYYSIAAKVARQNKLPLLTITMDRPDSFERVPRRWRGVQFDRIGRIYRQAAGNLAVSRQMSVWLRRVFQARSDVHYFAPSADIPRGDPALCRTTRNPGCFVLGYAGSLEYGYERQIAALLPELEAVGITLRVYTAHANRLPASSALDLRAFLPVKQLWQELLSDCDALLLPYPFSHEQATLYRTHFPTKLSEYYTLGLPLLLLGPSYATGIRWGLDHQGSALVVTDRDPTTWRQALLRLKQEPELRVQLAASAQQIATEFFSPAASQQQFQQALTRAAQPWS